MELAIRVVCLEECFAIISEFKEHHYSQTTLWTELEIDTFCVKYFLLKNSG
jgi:hypothetical protein